MEEDLLTRTGLTLDSILVVAAHFASFPVAIWFSGYRPSSPTAVFSRENVSSLVGVLIVVVCYRWDSLHLFLQWIISYTLLRTVSRESVGKYTFVVAFSQVLLTNLYKYIYMYGEFPIDYTGTLMLGTMKLSSLGFAIEDSSKSEGKMTESRRKRIIREEVSLREHFNYYFSFVGLIFGPFIFYDDYKRYMNNHSGNKSNLKLAILTLLYGLLCLTICLLTLPQYDVIRNYDKEVLVSGFLYKHWILITSMFIARCKYYFVWLTAQSLALFAGMGTGYDGITDTVNPLKIELATSLKQFIDNWNIFTAKWLRFTCFERVPKHKALVTFLVSAVWHGCYPGYMMMFLPLAFYAILGKKLHKVVRPNFQHSQLLRIFYAIITWCGTTIVVAFNGTGFQLLYFKQISQVQLGMYCYPHIIASLLFVLTPRPARKEPISAHLHNNNGIKHHSHGD